MAFRSRDAPPLRSAYAWLLVWALAWTVASVREPGAGLPLLTHVALLGYGFGGNLVMGVSHGLVHSFGPWRRVPDAVPLAESGLLGAATAAAAVSPWLPGLEPVAAWGLLAAALTYAGALAWQRMGVLPDAPGCSGRPGDAPSRWLIPFATGHAVLAGFAAVLWSPLAPASVHLWLVGFLTTYIFLVAHRVLARASTRPFPARLHWAQAACAAAGPLLLVIAVTGRGPPALALVEAAAVVLYVLFAVHAALHRAAPRNPLPGLAAAGATFLLVGVGLGLWFLDAPSALRHVEVHALNNLLGFLVLTSLGFATGMLGLGVRPTPRPARTSWWLGLGTVAALAAWEVTALSGATSLAAALAPLVGLAVAAHAVLGLRVRLPKATSSVRSPT